MEGQKECLEELTRSVCRTIKVINDALGEDDKLKRKRKSERALKELELVNDEAMRVGLGMSFAQIVHKKTRSPNSSKSAKSAEPSESKELTPHQQLMKHHADHVVGPIPDAGAQGAAIKWILQSFTPDLAIARYNAQLKEGWRKGHVSWLTVRQDIGRIQQNGTRPTDGAERNADRLDGNLSLIKELRSNVG